jgi:hypothetical protein
MAHLKAASEVIGASSSPIKGCARSRYSRQSKGMVHYLMLLWRVKNKKVSESKPYLRDVG